MWFKNFYLRGIKAVKFFEEIKKRFDGQCQPFFILNFLKPIVIVGS